MEVKIYDPNKYLNLNPLSSNPTKWPNKLKQFVSNLPTNCLSVFDHFVILAVKGLNIQNRYLQFTFSKSLTWFWSLQYGCCPVNLLHVFRTSFYMNTYGGLLLVLAGIFMGHFSTALHTWHQETLWIIKIIERSLLEPWSQ